MMEGGGNNERDIPEQNLLETHCWNQAKKKLDESYKVFIVDWLIKTLLS
jgi:hypothetical protein